tara:strand:- start:1778 stop:3049 length:1272 start_codon:yes stop_codon:yes gene_type:complete
MESNLLDYLIKNSDDYTALHIDLIKYELGGLTSHFGEHFSSQKEGNKNNWLTDNLFRDYLEFFAIKLFKKKPILNQKKVLSSAYSSWNEHFKKIGYNVERPPWNLRRDFQINCSLKLYLLSKKIIRKFKNENFNYLISNNFFLIIDEFEVLLKEYCLNNSYDALIVEQYNGFFHKLITKIFRELKKPVIFWHHGGIPANYDVSHQKRADYFVLMGQRQVDDYIKVGYSPSKFFVAGHPIYNTSISSLKFEYKEVLIITKAVEGYSPLETSNLDHRSNSLMYLRSIKKVLNKIGVNKVYLRPHPSENYSWYEKFVDTSFYVKDELSLENSLKRATLVIGPISTTIIDSMYHGVNYVVYEPVINSLTILGHLITPPLDGKDSRFPVAHSEEQFEDILNNKRKISTEFYKELVKTPRDISFLKNII